MPEREAPEPDPAAFGRTAREPGRDETGEAFERAPAHASSSRKTEGPADATDAEHEAAEELIRAVARNVGERTRRGRERGGGGTPEA